MTDFRTQPIIARERLPAWIEDYPEPTVAFCIIALMLIFAGIASLSPMKIGI